MLHGTCNTGDKPTAEVHLHEFKTFDKHVWEQLHVTSTQVYFA
jgi:hypothetical protein